MAVGAEDDLLAFRDLADDCLGARRGDDDVAQGFHRGRTVDVGERDMVRMRFAEAFELFGRTAVLEAASRVHVGQDDDLFGAQYLRGLGHELDAAKGDDVGVGLRRLARQLERIADEIGEVLDFGLLIIMREDDGVAFLAEPFDFGAQVEAREILPDGSSHGISLYGLALASPYPLPRGRATRLNRR